jgi:general L-amino acid transport system substrate-binding protein
MLRRVRTDNSLSLLAVSLLLIGLESGTLGGTIVERIKQEDRLVSAVNERAGLADVPTGRAWAGLSVDLAKALAAAVLQDPSKVKFEVGDRKTGPEAVQQGAVDLYLPVGPIAPSKLTALGLTTSQPFFFSVQRVMVPGGAGITELHQLVGTPIAVQPGNVNEQNVEIYNEERLRDYFGRAGWKVAVAPFYEWDELESAFVSGHVKAMTAEETELARLRVANHAVPNAVMLPEIIGMQPVSAVMQSADRSWVMLVKATISVWIEADQLGLSSDNLDAQKASGDAEIKYLLGVTPGIGSPVGLDDHWAERVIRAVGNYGQAFKRDLGTESRLAIDRGLNETWRHGGLLYADPIR